MIRIFNTETRSKEELKTIEPGKVKMYVCGPTVYNFFHLGNARPFITYDTFRRFLLYRGYRVDYVQNFTDIDDKMIKRANEEGITVRELADRFIHEYFKDADGLNIKRATVHPRATETMDEIIAIIKTLEDKGYAYATEDGVYFDTDKFAAYGKLSHHKLDELEAGASDRLGSSDQGKRHPMDFALWKFKKPGEPAWDSPWGEGRPGWHIECSAMVRKHLGETIDIHGGGQDLVFPHHENEIAQSEASSGKPFVATWIHHGFVTIKDEKMSKSLGNFLTIREILEKYPAEVLRFFVFSTHYRTPLDFSETAMKDAETGLDRLYTCLAEIAKLPAHGDPNRAPAAGKKNASKINSLVDRYVKAMDNDFNSAQALGHIFEVVKVLNTIRQSLPVTPAESDLALLHAAAMSIQELAGIMGLLQQDPVAYIQAKQQKTLSLLDIDQAAIESLISDRTSAREQKNWSRADEIRDILLKHKIEIKDEADGSTSWQVKI